MTDGTDTAYCRAKNFTVETTFGTDVLFDPTLASNNGKRPARLKGWYTPHEVLEMATHDNARFLAMSGPRNPSQDGPIGVLGEGAIADLIFVDGNPLENLDPDADPAKNSVVIIKDERIYTNRVTVEHRQVSTSPASGDRWAVT